MFPMPSNGRRLDPKTRKEQLLAFGRQHFAKNGFDSCSMDELAKQAGVSKALLYHYFGGRRGFFLASARSIISGLEHAVAEIGDANDIGAIMGGLVFYCQMNPSVYEVTGGRMGPIPELADQVKRLQVDVVNRCLGCLDMDELEAQPPMAQALLWGWVALVNRAIEESIRLPDIELIEFAATLERNFINLAEQIRTLETAVN